MGIDPKRLDPAFVFGEVLASQIRLLANEHDQLARKLQDLARDVYDIGKRRGLNTTTAIGMVEDVLRELVRCSAQANLAALVKAAADYERNVPAATQAAHDHHEEE